ncbi:tyrosine-type recombinase/integrase [Candidatus Methylomirabilis sp.]|uniref:Tyrosine-type recombinase/integrase n=1 Tax=Candidatus Methylomirabilis tolerans TaxID=3123416 RepID=A0AAJ1AGM9_9BACT|nr:tyrosine-type recombinase/integrase [Candidatus Methylomirabilis sp.]
MDPLPSPAWSDALSAFTKWLQDQGRRPLTVRSYLHDITLLARWLADRSISAPAQITPQALRDYVSYLQLAQRREATTINRRIIAIRRFCGFLTEAGLAPPGFTPASLRPLPLPPPTAPPIPSARQLRRLAIEPPTKTLETWRDYALVQLGLQAGLRLGDLADLQLEDLRLSHDPPCIKIRSGKGGVSRTVYLNSAARKALRAWLAVRPPSPYQAVFLSRTRGPLSRRTLHTILTTQLRRAGILHATPHTLRHAFATLLYREHKDLLLLKEALGHRKVDTSARYTRHTAHEIALAIEALDTNVGRSRPEPLYPHGI